MSGYLLVSSRDPFDNTASIEVFTLASSLARSKATVAILFVQNGVFATRAGAGERWLSELAAAGVSLLADGLSLRERGITTDRLVAGVAPSDVDAVIDALERGDKVLWH